ncbi:MAG: hypothetical protein RLO51_17440 [Thalassobaculum sp.]|uniref:DUF6312 domain-containing protein n=1 Tax=Thalassobaculum sp. TaxID=2022740 RepID=UPI0032ED4EF5
MSLRLSDDIERIVVIRRDAAGRRRSREVYVSDDDDVLDDIGMKFVAIEPTGRAWRGVLTEELGPRKKQSKWLRPLERRVRKYARRRSRALSMYLALHDHSNREKRNGWIRDLGRNLRKVIRKSK